MIRPEPLCAETPLERQQGILTRIERFYVRNNFPMPQPPTVLTIDGAVKRPQTLTPAELDHLPRRRLTATLECAGNGRSAMTPPVPGEPWGLGAVSTAEWEGVSLSIVLRTADVAADAVELVFHAADGFARSLPLDVALDEDILVVDRMNGEPLAREHGAPLRLLVPGWYGMASVKWLARIEVSPVPFRGHFQVERYVIGDRPVRTVQPRSLILDPPEGARVGLTRNLVRGVAWTGAGRVTAVELSDDSGQTWAAVLLLGKQQPYTWRRWEYAWVPKQSGKAALVTRATDSTGLQQPLLPVWNALGYCNNAAVPRQLIIDPT
ncbi:MAG: sulfite oxidase [Candidatus Dormibacteraeota bacterium]|nr:sulfite oxidase [Candidatus Dormibacteraeota bacterium]